MKLIYVASPYAGDVERNIAFAKKACRHVLEQGHAFFAPHLLYPQLLDDTDPQERQAGLDMGLAMLPRCDELWCYGEHTSSGMCMEIEEANRLGILDDETYLGHTVNMKTSTVSYKNSKKILRPESEWLRFENTHEGIIHQEIWDIAHEVREHKKRPRKNMEALNPYSGLVFCIDCTKPSTSCSHHGRKQK